MKNKKNVWVFGLAIIWVLSLVVVSISQEQIAVIMPRHEMDVKGLWEQQTREFEKEYGRGSYQMQKGALDSKDRVLVAYDILTGPGASKAAFELVEEEASVAAGVYITELEYLGGREELSDYEIHSLYKVFDA